MKLGRLREFCREKWERKENSRRQTSNSLVAGPSAAIKHFQNIIGKVIIFGVIHKIVGPFQIRRIIVDGFLFYGFINGELDFIINYDIKYRMGAEIGEEAEVGVKGSGLIIDFNEASVK